MSKNVLVIGGAGYVGTELVFKLLDKGYNVTVYDLLIYGSNFDNSKNLKVVKGDIRDIELLKNSLKEPLLSILFFCFIISRSLNFVLSNLIISLNYSTFLDSY